MQIVTYQNTRAPDGFQVVAIIVAGGKALPIKVCGRDVATVRAKAEALVALGGKPAKRKK